MTQRSGLGMLGPRPMTSPSTPIPMSSALALGLREAVSLAPATLALFAARAMAGLAVASLSWSVIGTWMVGSAPVGLAAAAGLLVFWLCAELLAGVVLAGALSQGRARLMGAPVPGFAESVIAQASRGLTYPFWVMAIQLLVTLWRWAALAAAATLYFRAIERGSGGFIGSSALALAIALALPLGLLAMLWLRVSLVDSVHAQRPVGASLFESVGLLRQHFFTPLAIIVIAGILAGIAEGAVSATLAPLASPRRLDSELFRLAALATLSGAVLAALPVALFELAGWHGLMALRLSWSGELPPSATPVKPHGGAPVLAGAVTGAHGPVTTRVIEARPIPSGHIVDARPVGFDPGHAASSVDGEGIVDAKPVERAPPDAAADAHAPVDSRPDAEGRDGPPDARTAWPSSSEPVPPADGQTGSESTGPSPAADPADESVEREGQGTKPPGSSGQDGA